MRALLAHCLLLAALPAIGQTNTEINSPWVQFNLSVPGARSLGFGGAFLGLADDATAAYANPAGLVYMLHDEVVAEWRQWDFDHLFDFEGGRPGGKAKNTTTGPSFVAYQRGFGRQLANKGCLIFEPETTMVGEGNYGENGPCGTAIRRLGFGFYAHRAADFQAQFRTRGVVVAPNERLLPSIVEHDIGIWNYGLSLARSFAGGRFALGAGLSYYDLEIRSRLRRFLPEGLETSPSYEVAHLNDTQLQNGGDGDFGIVLGALVWPSRRLRLGASYRSSAALNYEATCTPNEVDVNPQVISSCLASGEPLTVSQKVPAIGGIGMAVLFGSQDDWFGAPRRKLALDVYRVGYSVLSDRVVDVFRIEDPATGFSGGVAQPGVFTTEDGWEFHLGFEELVLSDRLFVRLGIWTDPPHALEYRGDLPAFQSIFRKGDQLTHHSVGIGTNGIRSQLDLAADFSDRTTTLSVSMVYRFGPQMKALRELTRSFEEQSQ